jgi:PadR family transcriptional regulator PadR
MMTGLPLLKGTLDVLVLKGLASSPMHGFELTRWLADRSGEEFEFEEAAVYQSLYRMEAKRLIEAEWGTSEHGRRARYYRLTPAGRAHYRKESALWRRYAEVVTGILDATAEEA